MAGYVRQSTADIQPGQAVAAGPVTNEFNQLDAAFNGTTGHSHDGSPGNSPKINLTTSVVGILPVANGGSGGNAFNSSSVDPTPADDSYIVNATWINTTNDTAWICVDNTASAAIWHQVPLNKSGTVTVPTITATNGNITTLVSTATTTGTLTVTTVSGHAVSGQVDMQSNKIVNHPLPTNNTDVATKQYADGLAFSSALPGINPGTTGQFVTNDGSLAFWAELDPAQDIWFAKYGF